MLYKHFAPHLTHVVETTLLNTKALNFTVFQVKLWKIVSELRPIGIYLIILGR